jgi:hypothetical protein
MTDESRSLDAQLPALRPAVDLPSQDDEDG